MFSFFIFIFGIILLLVLHEAGHYLAARLLDVPVFQFSIGIGKSIGQWRDATGCVWQLNRIPVGGAVRFSPDVLSDSITPFEQQALWKRTLIILAGPLTNFAVGIILFFLANIGHIDIIKPVMGPIVPQSIAHQGGFEDYMTITSIEGVPVATMDDARISLLSHALSRRRISIDANTVFGKTVQVSLDLTQFNVGKHAREFLYSVGFFQAGNMNKARLKSVKYGSPASGAGIVEGSLVVAIHKDRVHYWPDVRALLVKHQALTQPVDIELQHPDGHIYTATLQAVSDDLGHPKIGVEVDPTRSLDLLKKWYVPTDMSVSDSLLKASTKAWQLSTLSVEAVVRLIQGKESTSGMAGPNDMVEKSMSSLDVGFLSFLNYLGTISILICLMNLVPLPMLDGGHLVFYTLELIRGKPMSDQALVRFRNASLALMFLLTFIVCFNEIQSIGVLLHKA